MFLLITKSAVKPKNEESWTIYITKGKLFNFVNGACGNFYENLHWSLGKEENKTKYHAKLDIFMIAPLVSSNSSYIETVTIIS
jgi:hypothetical protein